MKHFGWFRLIFRETPYSFSWLQKKMIQKKAHCKKWDSFDTVYHPFWGPIVLSAAVIDHCIPTLANKWQTLRKPWQINQLKPSPENQPRFPRDLKR